MARRLPEDPDKRRKEVFKRVYRNLEHWNALREDRGMDSVITDELTGEDIYLPDLLVGLDHPGYLPRQQREAFKRIILKGYTATAARDEMLPDSNSPTPVQQYADNGLIRMMEAYDLKQQGKWPPPKAAVKVSPRKKKTTTIRRKIMAALHPLVRAGLEKTKADAVDQIKDLEAQIVQLWEAVAQVDELLGTTEDPVPEPAPNPVPQGRPKLEDVAKELMDASI